MSENENNMQGRPVSDEIRAIFKLFSDEDPVYVSEIDTSRGDDDFRKTFIIEVEGGERLVLKLAANDFTTPQAIAVWKRTVEEYRNSGYYSPLIYADKTGGFPTVEYAGHNCAAYLEEYAKYRTAADRLALDGEEPRIDQERYFDDVWTMSARIAAKRLDYTDMTSAWCLFDTFSAVDETDEVMENAAEWIRYARTLPEEFGVQVERIWSLWCEVRERLKTVYGDLPTSVFQADLNPTNILVDADGRFMGVCDYNLCGKEVFLNYLMRENYDGFEKEISLIKRALKTAAVVYEFSEQEKDAAILLYRCLKPLWYTRVEDLKAAADDRERIRRCLDQTEYYLTADIDFAGCMR